MLRGWCVISYAPVGVASRSGLIGFVVNVVCRGATPLVVSGERVVLCVSFCVWVL